MVFAKRFANDVALLDRGMNLGIAVNPHNSLYLLLLLCRSLGQRAISALRGCAVASLWLADAEVQPERFGNVAQLSQRAVIVHRDIGRDVSAARFGWVRVV